MALIISRVVRPASKLSTAAWWADTTLGVDLDVAGASTDEVYAAMDWLAGRQDAIETKLAPTPPRWASEPGADGVVRPVLLVGGPGGAASWPRAATPATARKAASRSSTGCSPTRPAARSRCGCSPATPPTRPRSPRS